MDKDEEKRRLPRREARMLTLEQRVQAIHAYDRNPVYSDIATMFNCSKDHIKNIIQKRKEILDFYEATSKTYVQVDSEQELIRQKKIIFLGECLYEYIQRAQYHKKADLTEEIIRVKAIELRDLIQIDQFAPVRKWMNHFKIKYNISLSQRQITLTRAPPASLALKDIITYCSCYKPKRIAEPALDFKDYRLDMMASTMAKEATHDLNNQRRQRKINFLMKALYEYIQRWQYHCKTAISEDQLRSLTCKLKNILKIHNFYPNKAWFNHFKSIYDFNTSERTIVFMREPPSSLDLLDILSYCSKDEAKTLPTQLDSVKSIEISDDDDDDDDNEEVDIKPNSIEIEESNIQAEELVEQPPLKIIKIDFLKEEDIEKPVQSPDHWHERSEDDEEELPKRVRNYNDALKLLKPIEEFAMLEEDYRVIGLISQLEQILKNPLKSTK